MPSGEFKSFPLSDIWVNRETRQRQEISSDKIEELADSISRTGLIHPPVIKRDGELIVGERRFLAMKQLGWTHMPVQFVDELSELELHLLELEENVKRVDLSWQEECKAVEEYHRLRSSQEEDWTVEKTAGALGVTRQSASQKIAVAKELSDEKIASAPKFSTARGIVERKAERKKAAVIAQVVEEKPTVPLLHEDFLTWKPDTTFNFIHCDFPYGVNADKHNQGAAKSFGGYADSADIYFDLLNRLESFMEYIDPSAHLMFWFSMDYYETTRLRLEKMGWRVNPFPLIWNKSDNTGILPDPTRGPRRIYETCFFASRGDRKIISAVSNVCSHPGREKSVHMSEKPRGMLTHFMRMVVDEYTTMLDPTCGSGNAVAAAEKLGAQSVLGLEKEKEFYDLATENYSL